MALTDALRAPLGWPGRLGQKARHHSRRLRHHAKRKREQYKTHRARVLQAKERAALRLDPELARKLLQAIEEPPLFPGVTGKITTVFDKEKCAHCVLPGALVSSRTPRPIESVKPGEEILGSSGITERVEAVAVHQYNGGIRTIRARGVLPLAVTDEHPILVYPAIFHKPNRSGWAWRQRAAPSGEEPVWKRADEIVAGDFLLCPLPQFDGPPAPERWSTSEAAWLLGLLAGDGYTHRRGDRRYHVGCVLSRIEHVDRAVAVVESWGLRVFVEEQPTFWRLTVSSRELAEDVAALIGTASPEKHLPEFLWSDKLLLASAVEGLMDADGHVTPDRGKRGTSSLFYSTSHVMAWQMWLAQLALGKKPYIRLVDRKSGYANARPIWCVESHNTKRNYTARTEQFYVMPVREVAADTYEGPVYDLTVSDSTFTVNGLLTHNCLGLHSRKCPAVEEIEYHVDGRVGRVKYWKDWDDTAVLWREDLEEAAAWPVDPAA